ncbi:hypothetical protein FRB94_007406 [Tulasnella sp. JGI-2019a]|nr:hypothetical protein FRB93_001434 [Tulasnella sp. JGI-2019a]KAG8997835.1 hypothetical protein FRB94_007406 [Tulasnella sp. JGI-2019a]KAG9027712.1 hypothetical protein FRB95_007444 [Tulasnella sp. JGI-2019a]
MSSNCVIPTEIWIQIIQQIGLPSHTSPYRLDRVSTTTLTRLCLVSRAFSVLTEPVLYSTAFITPETIESFSQAVELPQSRIDRIAPGTPTCKGALVSSLALANFNSPESSNIEQIKTILYAVQTSVVRLYLDTSRIMADPDPMSLDLDIAIQCGLSTFSKIEELCLLHWDSYSLPLAPWMTLKRIVIAYSCISANLMTQLSRMENLELCILAWPASVQVGSKDFGLREIARGDWGVSAEGRGSPELVITVTDKYDWVTHILNTSTKKETSNPPGNGEVAVKRPGLMLMGVQEVPGGYDGLNKRQEWTTRAVLDGTIWERHRDTLDVYLDRLDPS